jgi:hypothetical protein
MASTSKSDKVFIGIDDQVIELTGADKEAFEADRKQMREEALLLEAEQLAKQTARANAIQKLAC